ncbi:MAG: Asp-tRNA(Asn)/Glu-tRNA(Gln) amidotransferase GatCAB subunit B, partial [Minisyncoccales bacterium]
MFCGCSNDTFAAEANTLICPVCAGFPGTLPRLNENAVNMAIKASLALGCKIPQFSKFDRKSYFYPDLPSGFQISQFDEPIAVNGKVEFFVNEEKKSIRINRLHLENDAGKLMHEGHNSMVDWNRAGSPLAEVVTEPDFKSPEEVFEFLKEFQRIFRFTKTSDADMEKGMMRCDVNISVRKKGEEKLGTKVEIKNMNSFNNAKKAVEYEIK